MGTGIYEIDPEKYFKEQRERVCTCGQSPEAKREVTNHGYGQFSIDVIFECACGLRVWVYDGWDGRTNDQCLKDVLDKWRCSLIEKRQSVKLEDASSLLVIAATNSGDPSTCAG